MLLRHLDDRALHVAPVERLVLVVAGDLEAARQRAPVVARERRRRRGEDGRGARRAVRAGAAAHVERRRHHVVLVAEAVRVLDLQLFPVEAGAQALRLEVLDEADVVAAWAADPILPSAGRLAEVEDLRMLGDELVHGLLDLRLEARRVARAAVARGDVTEPAARRGRRRGLCRRRRRGGGRGGRRAIGGRLLAADGERRGREDHDQRGGERTGTQLHPHLQQAGRTRQPRNPGGYHSGPIRRQEKLAPGTWLAPRPGGFT